MAFATVKIASKMTFAALLALTGLASAQTAAPRVSGTVKAASAQNLTVTSAAGQEVAVTLSDTAKLLQVAPGSKDLKSATPIAIGEIVTGDKVIITGTEGDAAGALHATRVIVMKSADIAQSHAAEEAAWQHGGGGLVKSVDAASGAVVVSSGAKLLTVHTGPSTRLRRYSGDSVRFEDATPSQFSDIRAGDQLRVRGARSDDGSSIQADEIVTGAFRNFSGVLAAVDSAAGTVTLKDLATRKTITVKVTANSDVRHIPAEMAARFAARSAAPAGPAGTPAAAPAAGNQAGPRRGPNAAAGRPESGAPGEPAEASGSARAGVDLSQMLSRLPKEAVGDLKTGDAVMIVATQPVSDTAQPTAVTVLAGVEPILQASPKGEMTLTPWGVGGGAPDAGGGQ